MGNQERSDLAAFKFTVFLYPYFFFDSKQKCFILDLICLFYGFKERTSLLCGNHFFGVAVSLCAFSVGNIDPLTLTIRLLALNGYIALSIAAIMTPFLKEITLFFKKSFVKVHHYFAAAGLLLITLHPIAVFTQTLDPTVFLAKF